MKYNLTELNKLEIANAVMDQIDFERIEKTMEALNWGWASTSGLPPVKSQIMKFARKEILNNISNLAYLQGDSLTTSCGGFTVRSEIDWGKEDEDPALLVSCSFEVTKGEAGFDIIEPDTFENINSMPYDYAKHNPEYMI